MLNVCCLDGARIIDIKCNFIRQELIKFRPWFSLVSGKGYNKTMFFITSVIIENFINRYSTYLNIRITAVSLEKWPKNKQFLN